MTKKTKNQVLYNLNTRDIEYDLIPYCLENDITILAYTPLDNGRLCKSSMLIKEEKYKVLDEISNELGKTSGQVALNWCNRFDNVISIPKSNSVERTIENCGASGWKLSNDNIELLNKFFL